MRTPEVGPVTVVAGGRGSRMRDFIDCTRQYAPGYPKHLLPTGSGETLLGRIVRQASESPLERKPTINVSAENGEHITSAIGENAHYDFERFVFSMDPFYYRLRREASQNIGSFVLGCAGDIYSEFTWERMVGAHRESGADMSLLVQKTENDTQAALFDVESQTGRITNVSRPELSPAGSYTNVGVYVIEPTAAILSVLKDMLPEDPRDCVGDDRIFKEFVRRELVGIVEFEDCFSTNINTPREYQNLLAHTATVSVLAE